MQQSRSPCRGLCRLDERRQYSASRARMGVQLMTRALGSFGLTRMTDYIDILQAASAGQLPERITEESDPSFAGVRELVEAGLLAAIDASDNDGLEYMEPRITFAGREYLRRNSGNNPASRKLLARVERLRDTMTAVSTGGPRIQEANEAYRTLYAEVDAELNVLGIENANPFGDLWDWYGRWSSGDLPSYQSRRQFVNELFAPMVAQIKDHAAGRSPRQVDVTGWPKVDRGLGEARRRLAEADGEEQFQAVGLLCREVIISLAQAVYDRSQHPSVDGVDPSSTDAKRMLTDYLAATLGGSSNEVARKHARAAFDLANELQHRRTATFRQAALCVEATGSVVNVIAILSGRRDPA